MHSLYSEKYYQRTLRFVAKQNHFCSKSETGLFGCPGGPSEWQQEPHP